LTENCDGFFSHIAFLPKLLHLRAELAQFLVGRRLMTFAAKGNFALFGKLFAPGA
jgi:hypothetical protein